MLIDEELQAAKKIQSVGRGVKGRASVVAPPKPKLPGRISSFTDAYTDEERPVTNGKKVVKARAVRAEPEDRPPRLSYFQPDGWNLTSMFIDEEQQAAMRIQALRRGSAGA